MKFIIQDYVSWFSVPNLHTTGPLYKKTPAFQCSSKTTPFNDAMKNEEAKTDHAHATSMFIMLTISTTL